MIASNLAHAFTFHKASKSIVAAATLGYVDATLAKTWQELDFLNTSTEGGFRRVRMKVDTAMKKRASKVDKDKNESGWMSEIEGVVVDNPRKLRGARVYNLCIDEAGSFPNLVDTYIQARALVNILGYTVGLICLGGTGGDQGPQLAGLNKIFYDPEAFNILPYKNTYQANGQVAYTGFFIPSYEMWFGTKDYCGFDSRGVVDTERAKKYYLDKWSKTNDPKALIKNKAEYCFTPEDAFALEGSNRFDLELLVDQLHAITIHKTVDPPRSIKLHWKLDENGNADRNKRPTVEFCSESPIQIIELPEEGSDGQPYMNLYVSGCLTPGEKVLTNRGLVQVEDVTLDDKLFSINGESVKIHNLQRYYKENENVYKVKLNNIFSTTTFTGEHPIYCATPQKHYHGSKYAQREGLPYSYYTYDFGFKKMSDVQVGDFVKVPNIYKEVRPIPFEKWDESDIRTDRRVGNPLNNEDFWWLVGLILGDGWCLNSKSNTKIGITFNSTELFYIDKATSIIETVLHRHVNFRKREGNCAELTFDLLQMWSFMATNFKRGAANKSIPEWVKFLPNSLKLNLLVGYFAADGCLCKKHNSYSAVSCSLKLLEDFLDIAFSLGLISTVQVLRGTSKDEVIAGHHNKSVFREAWTLDIHGLMVNKVKKLYDKPDLKLDKWEYKDFANHAIPRCFFEDSSCDYIYIKIANIEVSQYTGVVYNFHCETSTFMCHYIPTHNCDSIDLDSTTATGQTDTSQFCMTIMRRLFGLKSPKIVAIYKDRPSHILTAFDTALKLCMFYNCKMLVEATRISIKQYFEKEHKLDFLMRRPKATANSWGKTNFKQFGCPATEHIIQHQLDLIEQYIVDYSDQIQFPEMLEELIRYSYENKRKFDIVAALGMTMLADEDMIGRTARTTTPVKNRPVITYVKNQWGLIELQAVYLNQNELVDGTRVQSSEPTLMYISARF